MFCSAHIGIRVCDVVERGVEMGHARDTEIERAWYLLLNEPCI
jgi:hypothetical protein